MLKKDLEKMANFLSLNRIKMNYEQYDELLRQKKDLESVIKEIQSNYYHELDKLIEINKQIKEMEEENE